MKSALSQDLNILLRRYGSSCFSCLIIGFFIASVALTASAQATELSDPQSACSVDGHRGACDKVAFQHAFAAASKVAVETPANDRMSAAQITQMLTGLGKTHAEPDSRPDLILHLDRINTDGVFVGPGGTALATLLVYATATNGGRGALIWAETFSGPLDMTWPAVVQGLISQFRSRLPKH